MKLFTILKGFFFIGFLLLNVSNLNATDYKVINGKIDFSQADLSSQTYELKGDWDFYWQQFVLPSSIEDSLPHHKKYVAKHPGPWTKVLLENNTKCSADGFGTYRLRIRIPNKTKVYALKLNSIFTAYKVFVNGNYIDGLGTLGKTKETSIPKFATKELPISILKNGEAEFQEFDLVIQVSNFHHRRAGTQQPISFGEMKNVIGKTRDTLLVNLLLIGIILIIGLNHVLMYSLRRMKLSNLIFGILSTIMILRNISTGERVITHLFPNIDWELLVRLDNFSGFGTISLFALYFYMSYKKDFPKTMFYIIMSIGVIITAMVFATPAWFYGKFRLIFEVYIGLGGLYLVFGVLLVAAFRKRPGAFLTFVGMFLLYATAINDVLSSMGVINSAFIAPYGIAAFMILQSYLHTRTSAYALRDNQKLSRELKFEKVKLEERIEERTKELSKQANELSEYRIVQEKQNWINESLNSITEIMRLNKDDLIVLADQLLAALVKKVNAHMGTMYFVTKYEGMDKLRQLASYGLSAEAQVDYIELNEGLAGKCFGVAKEEFLTDLPEKYFEISSGLGSASPRALGIFPMLIDELVIGVVEIASFKELTDVHKEFIQKALVNIASQLNIVKLNADNKHVLEDLKRIKEETEEKLNESYERQALFQEQLEETLEELEELKAKK